MSRYPELSYYRQLSTNELQSLYNEIQVWTAQLANELDSRDAEESFSGVTQISTVTTVGNFPAIKGGRIVYSTSSGTFYGFNATTSTWDALN